MSSSKSPLAVSEAKREAASGLESAATTATHISDEKKDDAAEGCDGAEVDMSHPPTPRDEFGVRISEFATFAQVCVHS